MKTPSSNPATSIGRLSKLGALTVAAALIGPATTGLSQTLWIGGTSDYNVPASWNPAVVPSGTVNAANDSGSANVVLIQPGDPAWQHGDTLAGNGAGTSGAYLQTGSTNYTGGGNWLRLGVGTGSDGYYTLSNGLCQVGGETHVAELGTGTLVIAGGTYNTLGTTRVGMNNTGYVKIYDGFVNNSGFTSIGQVTGGVGYYEINGGTNNFTGSQIKVGNGDAGNGGVGYFTMNGGVVNNTGELWIGEGTGANRGTGHFIMNGGTFNQNNNWFDIGRWGSDGDLTMTGGTINKTGGGNTQWAAYNNNVNSSATINMSGGAINILGGVVQLAAGGNGTFGTTCVFNQSGGTFHAASEYQIATDNSKAVATNNISGNAVLTVDNWLAVGRNGGLGVLNISGNAAVTKTGVGGNLTIGSGGSSTGFINQSGGTITNTATSTFIGESGTATAYWNMTNGTAVLGTVYLAYSGTAAGALNLVGGTFRANSISSPTYPATTTVLDLNGGTLQAGANSSSFVSSLSYAFVDVGGASLILKDTTLRSRRLSLTPAAA